MNTMSRVLLTAIAVTPLLIPTAAEAIPAWTRATGADCNACHFGGTNRLTKMGADFLNRGHRMASDEGIYSDGADEAASKWLNYLSFASKPRFTAREDSDSEFDVEAFAIYAGGPISQNFSFFVEHYLHERGSDSNPAGTTTNTTATRSKLADAYLRYESAPQNPSFWWARAGQIYPYLIYQAHSGGRSSINRPLVINNNVGDGSLYTARDRSYGVSGGWEDQGNGLRVEAGIINGAGMNARPNLAEKNNHKDLFLTATKELDEYGSSLGFYGYTGKFTVPAAGEVPAWEDSFNRYGLIGWFNRESYYLSGAWLTGTHDRRLGGERDPSGYYLEGAYNINPDLTGYARWDYLDNDLGVKTKGPTLGISQRIPKIGRVVGEYSAIKAGNVSAKDQLQIEINWLF